VGRSYDEGEGYRLKERKKERTTGAMAPVYKLRRENVPCTFSTIEVKGTGSGYGGAGGSAW
jgi:hypothetical protein